MSYVLVFLLLLFSPCSLKAADYLAGVGLAYPLQIKDGHTTTDKAGVVDLTQYPWTTTWGAIGLRETVWMFPSVDGFAGGIGPAGELRYSPYPELMFFVTASGSIGSSNLAGKFPEVTGDIQFGGQFGIGMEIAEHVRLELRYQHLSNGRTSLPNYGLDMLSTLASIRF